MTMDLTLKLFDKELVNIQIIGWWDAHHDVEEHNSVL